MRTQHFYTTLLTLSALFSLQALAQESAPVENTPAAAPASVTSETPVLPQPQDNEGSQAPAAAAPETPLTGTVQMTQQPTPAMTALTPSDYLEIQYKKGQSKHKLQEYTLSLNNKQAKHLEILQVEVSNGLSEEAYLQIQQQKSQAKRQLAGGMLRGLTSVGLSAIPYAGIGSYGAYRAIGVASNAAYSASNVLSNSSGSVDYSGRVMQRATNIMMSPNQQFQCLVVTPQQQQPQIKVIFKDLQTNQIYDLQK